MLESVRYTPRSCTDWARIRMTYPRRWRVTPYCTRQATSRPSARPRNGRTDNCRVTPMTYTEDQDVEQALVRPYAWVEREVVHNSLVFWVFTRVYKVAESLTVQVILLFPPRLHAWVRQIVQKQ